MTYLHVLVFFLQHKVVVRDMLNLSLCIGLFIIYLYDPKIIFWIFKKI